MNGKLKALGLALVAALALSAVSASAASAEGEFHSDEAHTIYDGEARSTQVLKTDAGTVRCNEVGVHATTTEAHVTEITTTPTYGDCTVETESGTLTAHVDMTGCDYLFTATLEGGHAPVHIECEEPGDHIDVNITFFGERDCIEVPEQTPTGGGVTYSNSTKEGKSDTTIDATVTGVEYTLVGICHEEATVRNNGTYDGEVTVSGTDTEENFVDIFWSEEC